jgi:hypothetical protein
MMRRPGIVLLTSLILSLIVPATRAGASVEFAFHVRQTGVAEVFGSTCPFGDVTFTKDTHCEDWIVLYFKEGAGTDPRPPWDLYLEHDAEIVHPDGTFDPIFHSTGEVENPEGIFDAVHLTSASVQASVPMSDGSQAEVDLTWDGTAVPIQVAGNDGPNDLAQGIAPHYVDRCITFIRLAHQMYRAHTAVSGAMFGLDPHAIPYLANFDPFLARGEFTYVLADHGSCPAG